MDIKPITKGGARVCEEDSDGSTFSARVTTDVRGRANLLVSRPQRRVDSNRLGVSLALPLNPQLQDCRQMMRPYRPTNLADVKTYSVAKRQHRSAVSRLGGLPPAGASVAELLE